MVWAKKSEKILSKNGRLLGAMAVGFVLVSLLVAAACFQYYQRLQDTIKTETTDYMVEISKQVSINAAKTIDDNFSVLETIATVIQSSGATSYDQLQKIVDQQRSLWNYQKIMLVDTSGVAYDDKGVAVALQSDEYLQKTAVNKEPSLSSSQVIDGKECIVFAIPLEGVSFNGKVISVLAASYDLATFDQVLSMTAFEGKGYADIVRSDGSIVVRSSSPEAFETGYNVLTSLSTMATLEGERTWDDLRRDLTEEKSGQVEFEKDGSKEYMTYTPLGTQGWTLLTFVPKDAVSSKSALLFTTTLILCGFITLSFCVLLFVLYLTFYHSRKKLEQIAYVDAVTKGNTIEKFNELAAKSLKNSEGTSYALLHANIEKFKVLNEEFGKESCNVILRSIDEGISQDLKSTECMGRLYADTFCILVRYESEEILVERFHVWYGAFLTQMEKSGTPWIPFVLKIGIFPIDDISLPFAQMVDRAKLSLTESNNTSYEKVRYAIYDERARKRLLREKQLEDRMEAALLNKEFQVYLQPKYYTSSEKIGGAEALVRWISPEEGMIYPDDFIPLFEKNGFIVKLDFWVFEEVCRVVRSWTDKGIAPVKVSINCSRIHLRNEHFIERYCALADKHGVARSVLEIELTENIVFDDVERLSSIITNIRAAGFGCSMDDFGSGYSSLNLIQDIPVDTIKLDRVFFRKGAEGIKQSEPVVKSVIDMSKALKLKTVAEGIEEREQVEMLKRLRCDYIQGYYFARPLPIDQFEKLAFGEGGTSEGLSAPETP